MPRGFRSSSPNAGSPTIPLNHLREWGDPRLWFRCDYSPIGIRTFGIVRRISTRRRDRFNYRSAELVSERKIIASVNILPPVFAR